MKPTLLLVCSANVCRSPTTAALLSAHLADLGGSGIRIITCGHDAVADQPVCPDTLSWADARGLDTATLVVHRARRLDRDLIGSADLVLALDRRARAAVLRLAPAAAESSFTLREAAELASRRDRPTPSTEAPLTGFPVDLNATRGLIDLPDVTTLRPAAHWWRPVKVHAYDVPDAHQEAGVSHRLSRQLLVPAVERLAHSLAEGVSR